jgi:hypothetical protein
MALNACSSGQGCGRHVRPDSSVTRDILSARNTYPLARSQLGQSPFPGAEASSIMMFVYRCIIERTLLSIPQKRLN